MAVQSDLAGTHAGELSVPSRSARRRENLTSEFGGDGIRGQYRLRDLRHDAAAEAEHLTVVELDRRRLEREYLRRGDHPHVLPHERRHIDMAAEVALRR